VKTSALTSKPVEVLVNSSAQHENSSELVPLRVEISSTSSPKNDSPENVVENGSQC
jgi:hypothetical protein